MSISPIGPNAPITRLQGSTAVQFSQGPQEADRSGSDTVEISDTARYLGEIKKLPDVRQDKVDAAKSAIESGTFETPQRINGTVDALMEELS
jgi:flagellar biosynthesis anti-sigma factor FlgM